jgi:hypothetical protein
MTRRGPASSYKPEYCALAGKLCVLGAINKQIADILEVSERIGHWMARHPDFKAAILQGRMVADAEIAAKLHERAAGYKLPAVEFLVVDGKPREVRFTRHLPPDTQAAKFWLRNRRRRQWGERIAARPDDSARLVAELDAAGERVRRARLRQSSGQPPSSG